MADFEIKFEYDEIFEICESIEDKCERIIMDNEDEEELKFLGKLFKKLDVLQSYMGGNHLLSFVFDNDEKILKESRIILLKNEE